MNITRPCEGRDPGLIPGGGAKIFQEIVMIKTIEIRAAEGGEDSRLFVNDLAAAYQRLGMKLG